MVDTRLNPCSRWLRFLLVASISSFLTSGSAFAGNANVIKASHHDLSPPLASLAVGASSKVNNGNGQSATARSTGPAINSPNIDPVAAPLAGPLTGVTSLLSFDGQSAQDNRNVFGFAFVPPDTNGAVGATQFVQMVNVTIAVTTNRPARSNLPLYRFILCGVASVVSAS